MTKFSDDSVSRRSFLRLGAASVATLGVAEVVAACGGSEGASSTAAPVGSSSTAPAGGGSTAAATAAGTKGGTLRMATSGGASSDTPDPAKALDNFMLITATQVYDTLVRTDLDFNLHPALATDWSASADGKTWTFKLRPGVKFHDGRTLTSKDVAYSIARVLNPKVGSPSLGTISAFLKATGISTPDPSTVRFSLVSPNVFFPLLTAQATLSIVPDGTTDFSKGIGTGPFKLQSFQALASARFTRNDDYWNSGKPLLDGVTLSSVQEDSTRIESVVSGTADLVDDVTGTAVKQLTGQAKPLVVKAGGWVDLAAWRNLKPFNDPNVLEAMKLAQDRKKIMGVVAPEFGQISADIPVPPGDPFYPEGLQPRPYDPEKAKSLLAKAGYGSGLDLTLYAYEGDKLDAALSYKASAQDAGINVKVVNWPHATYWNQVYLKKPFIGDSWARLHVSIILSEAFGSSPNESHFSDPTFNKLLTQALRTSSQAKQKEIYTEALMLIDNTSSCLIPGWEPQILGQSTKLSGVQLAQGGGLIYLDGASLAA